MGDDYSAAEPVAAMATLRTSNATAAASGTGDQPGIETAGSDAELSHVAASKDAQTPAKLPRTMPASSRRPDPR